MQATDRPPSYWRDTASVPRFGRLNRDLEVDVVVVGGGITGLTAAYLLKKAGATVALIERDRIGGVDTSSTTAHVTYVTDERPSRLVKRFGREGARAAWEAGQAAIDQIVAIIRELDIQCRFRWVPGYLHLPADQEGRRGRRKLQDDAELATGMGFQAEYQAAIPYFGVPGVRFPHQALFHPLEYGAAIARAIPGDGSHVFENTAAAEITDEPLTVKVGEHAIRSGYLVLATHTPLAGVSSLVRATLFQTKLYLYTSYVVGAGIPSGMVPEGSYWDTANPYRYLRVERGDGGDYAILGGEDHKTGQTDDPEERYASLGALLERLIPGARIDHRWSGQVIETPDGLPYIGETHARQFVATGYGGNGMTFGTLGAMMALDAYRERDNPWRALFDPKRKKLAGAAFTYLRENSDYPYHLVRDRLARAEGDSVEAVPRREGRILNLGGRKVAAYRDELGTMTLRSPVCTHLGCIVAWNAAEQTWDCPCHGSRFGPTGSVISGPAEDDLEPYRPESEA